MGNSSLVLVRRSGIWDAFNDYFHFAFFRVGKFMQTYIFVRQVFLHSAKLCDGFHIQTERIFVAFNFESILLKHILQILKVNREILVILQHNPG